MSSAPMTGDQRFVKNLNRMALLRLLRDESGLSRADLAMRSGLTKSTVSLLIKELIDEGWLAEDDALVTGALGRRPTPLRLDGRQLVLIGAELDTDTIRVVATSIRGEVLEVNQAALRSSEPDAACHQLVQMVTSQSAKVKAGGAQLLGIGVGLPGAVDTVSGVLQLAPNIGWRGVEVGRRLRAELAAAGLGGLPVYYQNEADLAAVGEAEFGTRPSEDPLVYVSCGVGVGSGIILNDSLFTGATGSAGEIGHTTLFVDGRPCSCGRLGCAEAYVGLRAVAAAAGCLTGDGRIDRPALKTLLGKRAAKARDAFGAAGDMLGVLLQNVWTTFNPQVIVLGGEAVALGGDQFLDAAISRLGQFASQAGLPGPEVRVARHAELATAVGGAAFVLHSLLRPYSQAPTARAGIPPASTTPVPA
ncbi:ROK family protein [Rhizobacter sp. LjRoot28]|uniref:ROK family protein n=1 Tax=Rhizobacter sp. LjRoot28 TaxID=3342309 RepID=UPI003ECE912D